MKEMQNYGVLATCSCYLANKLKIHGKIEIQSYSQVLVFAVRRIFLPFCATATHSLGYDEQRIFNPTLNRSKILNCQAYSKRPHESPECVKFFSQTLRA
jgi:hypothetical protein